MARPSNASTITTNVGNATRTRRINRTDSCKHLPKPIGQHLRKRVGPGWGVAENVTKWRKINKNDQSALGKARPKPGADGIGDQSADAVDVIHPGESFSQNQRVDMYFSFQTIVLFNLKYLTAW